MYCSHCGTFVQSSEEVCPSCYSTNLLLPSAFDSFQLVPGSRVGDMKIKRPLGEGGMGTVFLAEGPDSTDFAIKFLKPDLALSDPTVLKRFYSEAKLAQTLDLPNLIRVHKVGVHAENHHYMVMEYVEGENLRECVKRVGPFSEVNAIRLGIEIANALHAAHQLGVIHRDIKPENVMISTAGQVKLADLGLAKAVNIERSFKTLTGVAVGTPRYMPKEQFKDASLVDARSDVYSLALTLVYALSGKNAIQGSDFVTITRRVCIDGVPPLQQLIPECCTELQLALTKATQQSQARRFSDAQEFSHRLKEILKSIEQPNSARAPVENAVNSPEEKKSSSKVSATTIAAVLAIAILGVVAFFVSARPRLDALHQRFVDTPSIASAQDFIAKVGEFLEDQPSEIEKRKWKGALANAQAYLMVEKLTQEFDQLLESGTSGIACLQELSSLDQQLAKVTDDPVFRMQALELRQEFDLHFVDQADDLQESDFDLARNLIPDHLAAHTAFQKVISYEGSSQPDLTPVESPTTAFEITQFAQWFRAKLGKEGAQVLRRLEAELDRIRAEHPETATQPGIATELDALHHELHVTCETWFRSADSLEEARLKVIALKQIQKECLVASARRGLSRSVQQLAEEQRTDREKLELLSLLLDCTSDTTQREALIRQTVDLGYVWSGEWMSRIAFAADPTNGVARRDDGTFALLCHESLCRRGRVPCNQILRLNLGNQKNMPYHVKQNLASIGVHLESEEKPSSTITHYQWFRLAERTRARLRPRAAKELKCNLCQRSSRKGCTKCEDGFVTVDWHQISLERLLESSEPLANQTRKKGTPNTELLNRRREKRELEERGGSASTEAAVARGLEWLARHQSSRGSWAAHGFLDNCGPGGICENHVDARSFRPSGRGDKGNDVGMTALALLAFLGDGVTHIDGGSSKYRPNVKRAVRWLLTQQRRSYDARADGVFGPGLWIADPEVYNHVLATYALSELLLLSGDQELLAKPVELGIRWCLRAQTENKGWRYGYQAERTDTSVTSWFVSALRVAKACAQRDLINIPVGELETSLSTSLSYLVNAAGMKGRTGYMGPNGVDSKVHERYGLEYPFSKSLSANTAAAVHARLLAGEPISAQFLKNSFDVLQEHLPKWRQQDTIHLSTINFYYWYHGSYALARKQGSQWEQWNHALVKTLIPNQRNEGCSRGSWDPIGEWGIVGGRVYTTAIATRTLQVYYHK